MTRASAARAGPGEASAGPRLAPGPLPSRLSTQRERPALLSWRAGVLFSSPFRAPGLQGPPGASGGLQDVAPALFQCRRPERQASALARRLCSHRGVRIQGRPTTALSVRGPAGWPGRGPQSLPGPNRTGRWPIRRDEASVSCAQHSTPTPQSTRLCCPSPPLPPERAAGLGEPHLPASEGHGREGEREPPWEATCPLAAHLGCPSPPRPALLAEPKHVVCTGHGLRQRFGEPGAPARQRPTACPLCRRRLAPEHVLTGLPAACVAGGGPACGPLSTAPAKDRPHACSARPDAALPNPRGFREELREAGVAVVGAPALSPHHRPVERRGPWAQGGGATSREPPRSPVPPSAPSPEGPGPH